MNHDSLQVRSLVIALGIALGATCEAATVSPTGAAPPAGTSVSVTTDTAKTATPKSPSAARFAAPFATLAGSPDNALALANALRTGTVATLATSSTDAAGATVVTTTSITPPTKAMGWGNVSHALALTRFALQDAGIANPTAADLQAALLGGSVTAADGTTTTLAGVLQQRADGLGWGQIARSYGTTMGAVNRSLHPPVAAASAATATSTAVTAASGTVRSSSGTVTADGTRSGPRGLTTAASAAGTHGAKGLATAAGAGGSTGVVTGNGNAIGRGIVTASGGGVGSSAAALHRNGGSAGVVTAGGNHAVATAKGHGGGNGNANGKSRDGGG